MLGPLERTDLNQLIPCTIQDVSKAALQWYSKCYCVASVMKTFTLNRLQTIHPSRCQAMDSLYAFKYKHFRNTGHTVIFGIPCKAFFFKHPALPVEVGMNRNYPR
jgi:hypothetical protein